MSRGTGAVLGVELGRFRYSGAEGDTLAGISLCLEPGSLTVIVGDSGSGKSTLGAVLAGMLPRHEGDELEAAFRIAGQELRHGAGRSVRIDPVGWAREVGMLPQHARHYLSGVRETVEEELALGLENAGVPRDEMRSRIARLARGLGLHPLLARDPDKLSGGQERLVALAALAVGDPPVLVLDEPLAGLDAAAAARVRDLVDLLRGEGTALVWLTRTIDGLARGADRVLHLGAGRCTEMDKAVGPSAAHAAPALPRGPEADAEVLLEFAGAEISHPGSAGPAVIGLDLKVRSGECVGLAGPNGSGKTSVLKAAAGLLGPGSAPALVAGEVGLLLQDPADQLFERTVHREVGFGLGRRGAAKVPKMLEALGLAAQAQIHPYELPASSRRLLALATVLVRGPRVLLLDEPTEALDGDGLARLHAALRAVLDRGGAVLLSTHDEAFLAVVAHRVHRMEPPAAAPIEG